MLSVLGDIVFSEPSGRAFAAVQFTGSLVFAGIYLYSWVRGGVDADGWLLLMLTGFALSGIAESLPRERRRIAGGFRIGAILTFGCAFVAVSLVPELVGGA
jgi:hypothetical protein